MARCNFVAQFYTQFFVSIYFLDTGGLSSPDFWVSNATCSMLQHHAPTEAARKHHAPKVLLAIRTVLKIQRNTDMVRECYRLLWSACRAAQPSASTRPRPSPERRTALPPLRGAKGCSLCFLSGRCACCCDRRAAGGRGCAHTQGAAAG